MVKQGYICRFCLIPSADTRNIFLKDSDTIELIQRIQKILQIQLLNVPNWPKNVCSSCVDVVNKFHDFREFVTTNQCEIPQKFTGTSSDLVLLDDEEEELVESEVLIDKEPALEGLIQNEEYILYEINFQDKEQKEKTPEIIEQNVPEISPRRTSKRRSEAIKVEVIAPKRERKSKNEDNNDSVVNIDNFIEQNVKLECEFCPELRFPLFSDLNKHYLAEHNTKGYYRCCNIKLDRRWKLYDHLQFHLNPDKYKCDECNKNFNSKKNLTIHKKMVHLPEDCLEFQCNECDRKFGTNFQLNQHKLKHIKEEDKSFICPHCDKAFPAKFNLSMHVKAIHENLRPFVCKICEYGFRTSGALKEHEPVHDDNRNSVVCSHCDKLFKSERILQKHMARVSTSGVEHPCPSCNHRSPNLQSLKEHISRIHSNANVKKIKCTLCPKEFSSRKTLTEHIAAIHTGVKLYTCFFCPLQFNSNGNMYKHLNKMHKEEWTNKRQS